MNKIISNINDLLALILLVGVFPALWALQGKGILSLNDSIIGATIAIYTLIAQFYFRKKVGE